MKHSFKILVLSSTLALADIFQLPNDQQPNTFFLEANAFLGNDFIAMSEFFDDWNGKFTPKEEKNIAIASELSRIGFSTKHYTFALFHRIEVSAQANKDTLEVLYDDKHDIQLPTNKNFDVNLEIDGFESKGVSYQSRYAMHLPVFSSMHVFYMASLFKATKSQKGGLKGNAWIDSNDFYHYDARLYYHYNDNLLYDVSRQEANGYGYSIDLGFGYSIDEEWYFKLYFQDMLNTIYWKELALSDVYANSKNYGYTSLFYNPSISGTEKIDTIRQTIPTKSFFGIEYTPISELSLHAQSVVYKHRLFHQFGIEYGGRKLNTSYIFETHFKTHNIKFSMPYGYISFQSQRESWDKSQALGMGFGINIPF